MKNKLFYSLLLLASLQFSAFAQNKKSAESSREKSVDNIFMTWNKNTPESEMKDDVKALAEHGVTISYSDIKRNTQGEITAIKLAYSDKNGNTGSMSLNNQRPINTIRFFKQNDEVGFGEPANSGFNNDMVSSFFDPDMMKGFQFNDNGIPGQQFNFQFPNGNSFGQSSSSRVIIKKDGKKPLILENGNVIEGGDDYTLEEIEEIKKNNKPEIFDNKDFQNFNFGGNGNFQEQLQKMQAQIDQLMSQQSFAKTDKSNGSTDDEIQKAKEEAENARKEAENAKKEAKKVKSSLKTQKA
ncbi:MAG: hypothetical protein QM710_01595 [Flavobacterium sp.]